MKMYCKYILGIKCSLNLKEFYNSKDHAILNLFKIIYKTQINQVMYVKKNEIKGFYNVRFVNVMSINL